MMQVQIQPLNSIHNRKDFDCGSAPLNQWFANMAGQQKERSLVQTFVAVDVAVPSEPLGYYSLVAHTVAGSVMPSKKRMPNLIPVILLSRFAVVQSLQGKGLGKNLLMNALERVAMIAENVGVIALMVDAKDQKVAEFYSKYGFAPCPSNPLQLFLPVGTITQILQNTQCAI